MACLVCWWTESWMQTKQRSLTRVAAWAEVYSMGGGNAFTWLHKSFFFFLLMTQRKKESKRKKKEFSIDSDSPRFCWTCTCNVKQRWGQWSGWPGQWWGRCPHHSVAIKEKGRCKVGLCSIWKYWYIYQKKVGKKGLAFRRGTCMFVMFNLPI